MTRGERLCELLMAARWHSGPADDRPDRVRRQMARRRTLLAIGLFGHAEGMTNRDKTALAVVAVAGLLALAWTAGRSSRPGSRLGVLKKIDEKTDLIFW